MCNGFGYDMTTGPQFNDVTIEPHFCREYDDCGACQTMEKAIENVIAHLQYISTYTFIDKEERKRSIELAKQWRDGTHPDILYYLEEENELKNG